MPEARDRLSRPNDVVAEFYQRRLSSVGRTRFRTDENDDESITNLTPFRWGSTPLTGGGIGQRNGGVTPLTRGTGLFGSPVVNRHSGGRRQYTPPSGRFSQRGRGGNSWAHGVLPSWYPRTPLADISHIHRAIQRRERLGNGHGHSQVFGTPTPIRIYQQPADQDPSPSGAPKPKIASKTIKPSKLGKVPMIIANFANQGGGESMFLTPQKRLLNSIDIVEKVVMQELDRLKKTPTAKKAEQEKRVRTLMTMR